jgi:proline iminopeptidase
VERHPLVEPVATGHLDVGDGQVLYWETVGSPVGVPALYLHGGPGSGCTPGARQWFDPAAYRAVLFDQRGCGRSGPRVGPGVDLSVNTTDHLVRDIELLRQHLDVERWVVTGVSWGVTLALVYAQRHPAHVAGLALGAVTSGTRRETTWITREMGRVFPEQWEELVDFVPAAERDGDLAAAYARLLADPRPAVHEEAARRWCAWEDIHVSLLPGWRHDPRYDDPAFRLVFATMVTHYWSHGCFLEDGEILAGMDRLAGVPGILVHGRHDVSSPPDTAWRLHRAWPGSRLVLLEDAGHGGGSFGPAMVAALDELRGVR